MFEKIVNLSKSLGACYEKVFVLNIYAEFLFEENQNSMIANSK
jgi:hypothetical protein